MIIDNIDKGSSNCPCCLVTKQIQGQWTSSQSGGSKVMKQIKSINNQMFHYFLLCPPPHPGKPVLGWGHPSVRRATQIVAGTQRRTRERVKTNATKPPLATWQLTSCKAHSHISAHENFPQNLRIKQLLCIILLTAKINDSKLKHGQGSTVSAFEHLSSVLLFHCCCIYPEGQRDSS